MSTILIATVSKREIDNPNSATFISTLVSESRDVLIERIETTYKLKLIKNEDYDFPYFMDGGFKYEASDENWNYEFTCYEHEILK